MSYWSIAGGVVGGIVGGVVAVCSYGTASAAVPACISAGMALGGAVGGAVDNENAADESEAKQKQASEKQSKINEDIARRQARGAYEAAMNNPTASSDSLFTKAALQREANTNYASVSDKGNPFTGDKKNEQRAPVAPQFYGNVRAA